MNQEQIDSAESQLTAMNEENQSLRLAILQADVAVADAQKKAADAVVELKQLASDRDVLVAKRALVKEQYGRLYEEVGAAKKKLATAED